MFLARWGDFLFTGSLSSAHCGSSSFGAKASFIFCGPTGAGVGDSGSAQGSSNQSIEKRAESKMYACNHAGVDRISNVQS